MGGKDAILSAYGRKTKKSRIVGFFAGFFSVLRIRINTCFWRWSGGNPRPQPSGRLDRHTKNIFLYGRKNGSRVSDALILGTRNHTRRLESASA
jgi:hypothetical protein